MDLNYMYGIWFKSDSYTVNILSFDSQMYMYNVHVQNISFASNAQKYCICGYIYKC